MTSPEQHQPTPASTPSREDSLPVNSDELLNDEDSQLLATAIAQFLRELRDQVASKPRIDPL